MNEYEGMKWVSSDTYFYIIYIKNDPAIFLRGLEYRSLTDGHLFGQLAGYFPAQIRCNSFYLAGNSEEQNVFGFLLAVLTGVLRHKPKELILGQVKNPTTFIP